MKDVNLAYDTLMSHYSIDRSYTADQEYTSTEPESIVICPRCETMNRLTSYSPDFVPVCGRCGFPLYDDGTTGQDYSYSYYDYWEDRTPCSDGTCIGIIGPDGRCGVCGKPYQPESTSTYHEAPPKEDVVPPLKNPMISAVKKGVGILVGLALLCIFSIYFSKDSEEDTTPPESPRFSGTSPQDVFDLVEKAVPESATTDYMTVTKESFKKYDMCKENIQAIQVCLSNIGYQPGPPDGILGERTLAALNEFCQDFRVRQQDDLAEGLFQPLMRHREVAEIHPDWQKLVNSDDLASWIAEQNIEDPVFLGRLLYLGTSRQIVTLLGFYKFDKERPPPLPLPITGIIEKDYFVGLAPLEVKTKYKDGNYFVRIVNKSTQQEVLTAFIRAGETLNVEVPLGSCELRIANGKTWYGTGFLFGPNIGY
ncbi:MAG: hypothetical protein KAU38_08685, partial [Desulfobacterales bacterium]|nr:hypothetical protein [Desulfobacterales bacterium]